MRKKEKKSLLKCLKPMDMMLNCLIRIGGEKVKMVFKKIKENKERLHLHTLATKGVLLPKYFFEYNVRAAVQTTNTLEKILKPTDERNKYDSSGI
jgi:hypothetical protein